MARKDNKGRNLKTGEYQRPDGRYEYRYKDEITGKRNSIYAADLASLREMEKKINKDMDDLLITDASVKKLTVNTLFERYMATKNIKERTKKNYIRMWDYRCLLYTLLCSTNFRSFSCCSSVSASFSFAGAP